MTYDYTKPPDLSANNAIYLVVVRDETVSVKDKFVYIKTKKDWLYYNSTHLDIKGVIITKQESEKLKKEKNREMDGEIVHIHIPLHQWIKSYNISYTNDSK